MADSGINWDAAWTPLTKSGGGDWTALDVADNANAGSTAISMDGKACVEIGYSLVEDNTGAIDGDVTIYVLGDCDGSNYQEMTPGNPYSFKIRPVQNDTVWDRFRLQGLDWSSFKIWVLNESGQTLATTFQLRFGTIPPAS